VARQSGTAPLVRSLSISVRVTPDSLSELLLHTDCVGVNLVFESSFTASG